MTTHTTMGLGVSWPVVLRWMQLSERRMDGVIDRVENTGASGLAHRSPPVWVHGPYILPDMQAYGLRSRAPLFRRDTVPAVTPGAHGFATFRTTPVHTVKEMVNG